MDIVNNESEMLSRQGCNWVRFLCLAKMESGLRISKERKMYVGIAGDVFQVDTTTVLFLIWFLLISRVSS